MLKQKLIALLKNKQNAHLAIYGFGQGFNLVTPLLAIPYIVSKCGIANYGKIGVGLAVSFFLIVIIDFGSDIIGVKEISVNRDNPQMLEKIFVTTYTAKFLLMLFLIGILSVLFVFVPYFNTEKSLFFLCLPILVGQFINPVWFFQGIENFNMITALNFATKLLYLFGVFVFIKSPGDYIYVNLWWGLGMIIPFLIGFCLCVAKFNFSFSTLKMADVADFIKEDYKFCISQLFLSLKNYSPIMLIGFLGGFTVAGQYKIIEQVIMPFRTYLQVFFRFFYPKLCYEIFQDKRAGLSYWKKINVVNFAIVLFLLALVFIFSTPILTFFKVEKENLASLSEILRFALLIPLFITGSFTLEQLLFSIGKKSMYINITIITVIINFIMMYFLFRSYGLYGLITSILITETMVMLSYSVILKPFFNQISIENGHHTI